MRLRIRAAAPCNARLPPRRFHRAACAPRFVHCLLFTAAPAGYRRAAACPPTCLLCAARHLPAAARPNTRTTSPVRLRNNDAFCTPRNGCYACCAYLPLTFAHLLLDCCTRLACCAHTPAPRALNHRLLRMRRLACLCLPVRAVRTAPPFWTDAAHSGAQRSAAPRRRTAPPMRI